MLSSLNHHNVPCSVCYVATRSVAVMVPAKTQCPTDWTVEYVGYLMSENHRIFAQHLNVLLKILNLFQD